MATIKSFTSLEQSRKLAEILPLESADMSYIGEDNALTVDYLSAKKEFDTTKEVDIFPCWSLAVLLDVLPIIDLYTPTLKMKLNHKYYMELYIDLMNHKYITTNDYDSPVDACVAIIEKLHELKML